jgi:ketosteroid isomerase-like protein
MKRRLRRVLPVVTLLLVACGDDPAGMAPGRDRELSAASASYMKAWLANDPDAVMATFVDEPVLSPSGRMFLEGQQAARGFWWPKDSPPTEVARFDYEELEARASGGLGYVRGTFTLVFRYEGETYTNRGTYLHILRKTPLQGWRISHHFWNDLPADAAR